MHNEIKDSNILEKQKIIIFMTALTSILLNHSNKDFGINLSLSDISIFLSILLLIIKGKFVLPKYHTMFFLILSIILLMTSVFYSPFKFNFIINYSSITKDYLKLLTSFLFFLLGYNISRLNIMKINVKWYSIGAMIISSTGLLMKLLNINYLNSLMYFGSSRFRGLMSDPNYYSIVQCTALVYFLRQNSIFKIKKILLYVMNFVFIAMSGSKTGMVTLIIYSFFVFLEHQLVKKKSYKSIIISLFLIFFLILSFPLLVYILNTFLNKILALFPVFKRMQLLFEDFFSAIVQEGSDRDATWGSAVETIRESPLVGVGLGSYTIINRTMFKGGSVAHNTYLQIFAEWGGILGLLFFGYIFLIIAKVIFKAKSYNYDSDLFITRDIVLILLIGSLAVSLNNARMFWMFLGGLVYYIKN